LFIYSPDTLQHLQPDEIDYLYDDLNNNGINEILFILTLLNRMSHTLIDENNKITDQWNHSDEPALLPHHFL